MIGVFIENDNHIKPIALCTIFHILLVYFIPLLHTNLLVESIFLD